MTAANESVISVVGAILLTEGSQIDFSETTSINIEGSFYSIGTSTNRNTLTFNNTTKRLKMAKTKTIFIDYSDFVYGGISADKNDGISASVDILNSTFNNTISLAMSYVQGSTCTIQNISLTNFNELAEKTPEYEIYTVDISGFENLEFTGSTIMDAQNSGDLVTGIIINNINQIHIADNSIKTNYRGIYSHDLAIAGINLTTNKYINIENNIFIGHEPINNPLFNGNFGINLSFTTNSFASLKINNNSIDGFFTSISLTNTQNLSPQIITNVLSNFTKNGIIITNGSSATLKTNMINPDPNTSENPTGIYLSSVSNPKIISNSITAAGVISPGSGIFMNSCNGSILKNTITGYLYGIELGQSSPQLAENIISGNKVYGIYASSRSIPDLSTTLIGEQEYPLSGYNTIRENGECEYESNSEIFLDHSKIKLDNGCNTIADDRPNDVGGICDYTLLIDGIHSQQPITADSNYWGNHPIFGNDPAQRFGSTINIIYQPFLTAECSYGSGGAALMLTETNGEVIDTLNASGTISGNLSAIEQLYSQANLNYYNNNFTDAKNIFNQIISSYGSEFSSVEAYNKIFVIEKSLSSSAQSFVDLREFYNSKLNLTQDSLLVGVLIHLSDLCLVAEEQYITAINNFGEIAYANQNTDLGFYSTVDALTTSLLVGEGSLGKISGLYIANGIQDYQNKIKELMQKRNGNLIDENKIEIPTEYQLYQNYPNPFNPTTSIKFDLPQTGNVELTVYDILGRKVKQLLNETKPAGTYEVTFIASNLASGVYIYTIKSNDFTASKKLMLLK